MATATPSYSFSGVFSIPSGVPFAGALARGLLEAYVDDPLALSRLTLLLPSRRAALGLRAAFLRESGGTPLLLPRLLPVLGDGAEELADGPEAMLGGASGLDLPPAVPAEVRQLLLTRLIAAAPGFAVTLDQAARLAGDLGGLIDETLAQGLDFSALAGLVPERYARHWQDTLQFLGIITSAWPAILAATGTLEAAERRRLLLERQAELWEAEPPAEGVLMAGVTASQPALARLMQVVAALPSGAVVLPGLDTGLDEAAWEAASREPAHPQYLLARSLQALGRGRETIPLWPGAAPLPAARHERVRLLAEALRPAETTEGWSHLPPLSPAAVAGLARLDCATPEEEAGVAALLLRQALEVPGRTAALVTPDRDLARRTARALERWGILVDDSGGTPLAATPAGSFLRLVAEAAAADFAALPLLCLAKHPLFALGESPAVARWGVRALELAILRGPAPAPSCAGLQAALAAAPEDHFSLSWSRARLGDMLARLEKAAAAWRQAAEAESGAPPPLSRWLALHVELAEALAASDSEPGAARLWRGEDGLAAADALGRLLAATREGDADLEALPERRYPALFEALIAGKVVRPRHGRHPRLAILGPLEARLQPMDLMILGGLNEGVWPPITEADPWLSRPMRAAFGLPPLEERVGLAAHDFAEAAAAAEVVLTRAGRSEGAPTVPSRWLLRLEAVLRAGGLDLPEVVLSPAAPWAARRAQAEIWRHWRQGLDTPARVAPCPPPAPVPPLAARPRRLSVTQVEVWRRDPYAIYARHILRLQALEPLAAEPGAAERGMFIHAALATFLGLYPHALPPEPEAELLRLGREALGPLAAEPEIALFWLERFRRLACWFVAREAERRQGGIMPLAQEVGGMLTLTGPAGPFTLTAQADRIDRLPTGGLEVIDYKTGGTPKKEEVSLGFSPQLPLEAALAACGGFIGIPAGRVESLAYWELTEAKGVSARIRNPLKGKDPEEAGEEALEGLLRLITLYDNPATPYPSQPKPERAPRYTDYAHLARVQEWSLGGSGEGEDADTEAGEEA